MKMVFQGILVLVVAMGFCQALNYAFDQNQKADCVQWAQEADSLTAFYLTPYQSSQCRHYNIVVNAPVRAQ